MNDLSDTSVQEMPSPVLVVDLDETLSRTDTFHEAVLQILVRQPAALWHVFASRPRDKAAFKKLVGDQFIVPVDHLMLDQDVLSRIEKARQAGQKVVLVSASDHRQVATVANQLGLFDEFYGTGSAETEGYNLGGERKAEFLVARYGQGKFDYIGDCVRDIPVWQAAKTAYAVAPSARLQAQARHKGLSLRVVGGGAGGLRPYLKALRPHQWIKNILIFLPMMAAQQLDMFWLAFIAFVLFSLTASSVYVFNDLVDLPSDRIHPRKRVRPFAAGQVSLAKGLVMGLCLLVVSFLASLLLMPPIFCAVLTVYFLVTVAYSLVLKRKLIVDVIVLAGLYTTRIIAGGAATDIIPSPWLLAFSVFLFYALASVKRQAELIDQAKQQKETTPGRGYVPSDVSVMQTISICSGQAAVLVFALYLYSPSVTELYTTPQLLWLICPILLYWLSRIAIITHRGFMQDDPIVFAIKDRVSLLTAMMVFLIILAAEWNW